MLRERPEPSLKFLPDFRRGMSPFPHAADGIAVAQITGAEWQGELGSRKLPTGGVIDIDVQQAPVFREILNQDRQPFQQNRIGVYRHEGERTGLGIKETFFVVSEIFGLGQITKTFCRMPEQAANFRSVLFFTGAIDAETENRQAGSLPHFFPQHGPVFFCRQ